MFIKKTCLIVFLLCVSYFVSFSQAICGTSNEGGSVTLTAPAGSIFTSVTFASYGTPNGSCGSFTIGGCHAANSKTIVENLLLGNNSANIGANNGVFGDPCGGTFKRLYIEAVYSLTLPVKLVSFNGTSYFSSNQLSWETTNEINTKEFQIEKSEDGIRFSISGIVGANNQPGNNHYSFSDNLLQGAVQFYRIKMIDIDGTFMYSNIIKLGSPSSNRLTVFPNPVVNTITVGGLHSKGVIEITDIQGRLFQKINVVAQTQVINLESYSKGVYVIKYFYANTIWHKKIVKD